jgi:hypothetical protein
MLEDSDEVSIATHFEPPLMLNHNTGTEPRSSPGVKLAVHFWGTHIQDLLRSQNQEQMDIFDFDKPGERVPRLALPSQKSRRLQKFLVHFRLHPLHLRADGKERAPPHPLFPEILLTILGAPFITFCGSWL